MMNDVLICVNGSMIFTNYFSNVMIDPCREKRRMGRGLERISRGFDNKIKLHIAPGNKRPEAPMQAAKLASKAGIFIRGRIPIFPHWKDYKDPNALEIMNDYMKNIGVSAQLVFSFALH
jgi:hypothetical protein